MDTDMLSHMRGDQMSEIRSHSCSYHRNSQSKKMSIGVVLDSYAKSTRPAHANGDVAAVPFTKNLTASKGKSMQARKKGGVSETTSIEKISAPMLETYLNRNCCNPEVIHSEEQTLNLQTSCKDYLRMTGVKRTVSLSSQVLSYKTSAAQCTRSTYGGEKGKNNCTGCMKKISLATAEEIVPERDMIEDKAERAENRGSETLRMKLWEILGTVSSPNKQCLESQPLEIGVEDLRIQEISRGNGKPILNLKQNSDTIESDSENHDRSIRRPATRSFTRKKVHTKLPGSKEIAHSTSCKKEYINRKFLSSKEELPGRWCNVISDESLTWLKKNDGGEQVRTEDPKIASPQQNQVEPHKPVKSRSKTVLSAEKSLSRKHQARDNTPEQNQTERHEPVKSRSKTLLPAEKTLLREHRPGDNTNYPKNYKGHGQQEIDMHGIDIFQSSSVKLTELRSIVDSLKLHESMVDHQEDIAHSLAHSPTLQMQEPINYSYPGSAPKGKLRARNYYRTSRPFPDIFGIRSFKSLLSSKSDCYRPYGEKGLSGNEGEDDVFPPAKLRRLVESDPENKFSEPSAADQESVSSEDYLQTEGCKVLELSPPETTDIDKKNPVFRSNESCLNQKGLRVTGESHTSASLAGVEKTRRVFSHLGCNQEDDLTSAVTLFALGLERVNRKIKLAASKRSAEILTAVAEELHLQLQNAESQILEYQEKLTGLIKSKRKRMETKFQEHQEQLNCIYETFKKDVNSCREDCRGTLESYEIYKLKLEGIAGDQRAQHRKIVLQAEAAYETQLADAHRRIMEVQNLAEEKILQLKNMIAGCLEEGKLS